MLTFKTTDLITRPLPSMELMELQFHLQRVAAMSGAGEWEEEDDAHDNKQGPAPGARTFNSLADSPVYSNNSQV